jgi:hypothetical protein
MAVRRLWAWIAGLGVAGLVAAGAMGMTQAASRPRPDEGGVSLKGVHTRYTLHLTIVTGTKQEPDWPAFLANGKSSARIVLPAHALVTVELRSYDDGAAPTPAHFAAVDGTVGGVVRIGGKAVKGVAPKDVSHTFTVVGLDLNAPVPAVTGKKKFLTETFQFVTGAPGTWEWQCYAPCGTGKTGWDGPMITPGYMMGTLVVR